MKVWRFFVIGYLLLGRVYAEDVLPAEPSYMDDVLHMAGTLLLLLAFITGALFFVKRMMRSRLKIMNSSTSIKVLERRALHPKASLYLIEVLGKMVLISDSQGEINLITEISGPIPLPEESQNPPKMAFKEVLQNKLSNSLTNLFKKPQN